MGVQPTRSNKGPGCRQVVAATVFGPVVVVEIAVAAAPAGSVVVLAGALETLVRIASVR